MKNPNLYVIYLRKSRSDDPNKSVEEVLEKHEAMLQEYAEKELGGRIPEENIYREVISGESIEERIEMQKLLSRIEDPKIKGVLVVEPQRLSRGDLTDCGRLINELRYSRTLVVTPMMTYDLENKMERKFFQDELLRGRDYLEYTKEILLRGRIAAVKRGCFIGRLAPYGYKKVKIGKDGTLEPVEEEAEIVRLAFDLYTKEGLTPGAIAKKITDMGVPTPKGGNKWVKDTIRVMLRNKHYIGLVFFFNHRETYFMENGQRIKKSIKQNEGDMIIAEGKHPAIIDRETWDKAQELIARNPRTKHTYELRNPFSGILRCSKCGKVLFYRKYSLGNNRLECRTSPICFKSVKFDEMYDAILTALESVELPSLELKIKNGDGNALKIQQKLVAKLTAQLDDLLAQEEKQFDFLETGLYTQDIFEKRHAALMVKLETCREQLFKAKASMPKSVDYAERAVALKSAIDILKVPDATPTEKNKILRAIVERIEYTGSEREPTSGKLKNHNNNEFSIKVLLRL